MAILYPHPRDASATPHPTNMLYDVISLVPVSNSFFIETIKIIDKTSLSIYVSIFPLKGTLTDAGDGDEGVNESQQIIKNDFVRNLFTLLVIFKKCKKVSSNINNSS